MSELQLLKRSYCCCVCRGVFLLGSSFPQFFFHSKHGYCYPNKKTAARQIIRKHTLFFTTPANLPDICISVCCRWILHRNSTIDICWLRWLCIYIKQVRGIFAQLICRVYQQSSNTVSSFTTVLASSCVLRGCFLIKSFRLTCKIRLVPWLKQPCTCARTRLRLNAFLRRSRRNATTGPSGTCSTSSDPAFVIRTSPPLPWCPSITSPRKPHSRCSGHCTTWITAVRLVYPLAKEACCLVKMLFQLWRESSFCVDGFISMRPTLVQLRDIWNESWKVSEPFRTNDRSTIKHFRVCCVRIDLPWTGNLRFACRLLSNTSVTNFFYYKSSALHETRAIKQCCLRQAKVLFLGNNPPQTKRTSGVAKWLNASLRRWSAPQAHVGVCATI